MQHLSVFETVQHVWLFSVWFTKFLKFFFAYGESMLKNTIAETGFAGNADITAENQTNNTIILSVTSLTPGVLTNI